MTLSSAADNPWLVHIGVVRRQQERNSAIVRLRSRGLERAEERQSAPLRRLSYSSVRASGRVSSAFCSL
jgi:hypothetical protein